MISDQMNQLMNDVGDSRTSPAKRGLLHIFTSICDCIFNRPGDQNAIGLVTFGGQGKEKFTCLFSKFSKKRLPTINLCAPTLNFCAPMGRWPQSLDRVA